MRYTPRATDFLRFKETGFAEKGVGILGQGLEALAVVRGVRKIGGIHQFFGRRNEHQVDRQHRHACLGAIGQVCLCRVIYGIVYCFFLAFCELRDSNEEFGVMLVGKAPD